VADDALMLFDLLVKGYDAEPAAAFEVAAWCALERGRTGTWPADDAILSRLSEANGGS
jgi:hypothetical protein